MVPLCSDLLVVSAGIETGRSACAVLTAHLALFVGLGVFDMTVFDEGDVKPRVSIIMGNQLIRVLFQQLSKAHPQARVTCMIVANPDRAVCVAWITELLESVCHSLCLHDLDNTAHSVGCDSRPLGPSRK